MSHCSAFEESFCSSRLHFTSLPGTTTHAGSWPTQEVASNHLYPWPCSSNFWLPASLHPSSLHPSIWGLAFPLAFCPPACPRWFSYMVDLSCIHTICPVYLSLVILIATKSVSSYRRYSSSLYLDLHIAPSQIGPLILLNIFLSKTPRHNSSALLRTQVSAPYIRTGLERQHCILTSSSVLVTWCTTSLTFNNCTLCPHYICVFCIYLRTNSDLCHLQHKLIGFYNRDEKCLQRGTDWVFKQSGLRFDCKGLKLFRPPTYRDHPQNQKALFMKLRLNKVRCLREMLQNWLRTYPNISNFVTKLPLTLT